VADPNATLRTALSELRRASAWIWTWCVQPQWDWRRTRKSGRAAVRGGTRAGRTNADHSRIDSGAQHSGETL